MNSYPALFKILGLFFILLCQLGSTLAQKEDEIEFQPPKQDVKTAEQYFMEGKYNYALQYYLHVYNQDSNNTQYAFAIGVCYLNGSGPLSKVKAIPYLQKALNDTAAGKDAHYYLGWAYHLAHRFEEARLEYESYKQLLTANELESLDVTDRRIRMSKTGLSYTQHPKNVQIINMGPRVNSRYGDYSPVLTADEELLMFTSRRSSSTGGLLYDYDEYYEDIYMSRSVNGIWQKAIKIDSIGFEAELDDPMAELIEGEEGINTTSHDAVIGLSADGQKLFFYRSDNKRGGDIYICILEGERWSKPIKLPSTINSKHWEGHVSMSSNEDRLFFSSNRPGGFGGTDIYVSKRVLGGNWSEPVNLGPRINTKYNEDAPFIHANGVNLYFSSDGHESMGGFDIYMTRQRAEGGWSEPQNMGFPVNTADDDIFFTLSANGEHGYFSSAREGGYGHQDLYVAQFDMTMPALSLLKGRVTACGNPIRAEVTVVDNKSGLVQGIYSSNAASGKYLIALPAERNYSVTFSALGYLFHSENVFYPGQGDFLEIIKDIELHCAQAKDEVFMNNIFFAAYEDRLLNQSFPELQQLQKFLSKNPDLKLKIRGYLRTGSTQLDQELNKGRASAVVNWLVKEGINSGRLQAASEQMDISSVFDVSLNNKISIEVTGGLLGENPKLHRLINCCSRVSISLEEESYKQVLLNYGSKRIKKLQYHVQVGAFRNASLSDFYYIKTQRTLNSYVDENEITHYFFGPFKTILEADMVKSNMINQGIADAWVVPYLRGEKITMKEVRRMNINRILILLNGVVVDEESQVSQAGASVMLLAASQDTAEMFSTVKGGRFQFNLQAGNSYILVGSKEGFVSDTTHVSTTGVTVSESMSINLKIRQKPPDRFPLKGIVVDEDNIPFDKVLIQITNQRTNEYATIYSARNGGFEFELQAGTLYSVKAQKQGYIHEEIYVSTEEKKPFYFAELMLKKKELAKSILVETIYYKVNEWQVNPSVATVLDDIVLLLNNNLGISIELSSHTDSQGSAEYNQNLSRKRADAAVAYIVNRGISSDRISARGYGESRLANDCDDQTDCTEEEHSRNRRIECIVTGID